MRHPRRPARCLGALLAVPLVLLGAPAVARAADAALPPVSGGDPVAGCVQPGQTGAVQPGSELGGNAAVSADGRQVVGVYLQDPWTDGGARAAVAAWSLDGGRTVHPVPVTACASPGSGHERAGGAWVSLGPDGAAYVAVQTLQRSQPGSGITVAVSPDGGHAWRSADLSAETGTRYSDQLATVTADPVHRGTAYAVWSRYDHGPDGTGLSASTMLATTRNGGRTWTAPVTVLPAGALQVSVGGTVLVDRRDGTLYCVVNVVNFTGGTTPGPDRGWFSIVRSTDGGATWSAPTHVAEDTNAFFDADPNTGQLLRASDGLFTAAIDAASGELYVAYEAGDLTDSAFDQAQLVHSTDGGATWSPPSVVSSPDPGPALEPTVAVAGDGTVAVTYESFTDLAAGDTTTLPTTVWLAVSADRGATFTRRRVGPDFDLLVAPQVSNAPDLGLYQGLAAAGSGDRFWVQYVATRPSAASPASEVLAGWVTAPHA